MNIEYQLTLHDYLLIIRRRFPYLIGISIAGLFLTVAVAIYVPPSYKASGTIMVESPVVPEAIVQSVIRNQLDERINEIMQRVMTRDNLLQISDKFGLYKEVSGEVSASEMADRIRKRISIEKAESGQAIHTNQQGHPTMSFTLSFEDKYPDIAFQVTNEIISSFLDRGEKMRTEGAAVTTAFLTEESKTLRQEVDRLEKQISDYKRQNKNALPEQLTLRMTMLTRAENDLREVERDIRSTKEDIRSLEVELAAAKQGHDLGDTQGVNQADTPQTLPALKAELARLSTIYKESHPDIRMLKSRIEAMEKAGESGGESSAIDPTNVAVNRIKAKILADNARLSSLAQQKEMLQGKISENESAMIQTPKVEQGLNVLLRDRDAAQKKYEELRNKQINARMAENLESENKSERYTLLEPPVLPEKPYKPNRIKIFLIGLILSLASSGGFIMVLETVDKRVRGIEAIAHVLGQRPLAVIPYIPVKEEEERRKHLLKLAAKIAAGIMVVAAIAVHFLYMHLDDLLIKILARL